MGILAILKPGRVNCRQSSFTRLSLRALHERLQIAEGNDNICTALQKAYRCKCHGNCKESINGRWCLLRNSRSRHSNSKSAGEKKAQKRVCEVCRCGRLARYAFVNSSRVWRGRYDESRIEDTSFTPLLLTNLALQNIILSRQEAAQIQAGNACSERNTEISEEHRTLNTKSTILSPCELFTCRHFHPQQFCPSPSPYLCSFSNLLFIDIGSGNFQ